MKAKVDGSSNVIEIVHQLSQRTILALHQCLVTTLADAQTAEHAAMAVLPIKLEAGHARNRAPHVLCHGHVAMFLETGEVDLVQRCRDGLGL